MAAVDDKMAVCPLKHEVRIELWERYIRLVVGDAPMRRYLTLYSPPLMDVKLFAEKGLIEFDGSVYKGVVGATYDGKAFSAAQKTLRGRLELLLDADINLLLEKNGLYKSKAKQLADMFPFDAVNLDYTNSVFDLGAGAKVEISEHLAAVDSLINRQRDSGAKKFALMITTRADLKFAAAFLDDIDVRINDNIRDTPGFGEEFVRVFGRKSAEELRTNALSKFLSLGLAKFVAHVLRDYNYRIANCDAHWLIRDGKLPVRELLHLAFLVEEPPRAVRAAKKLRDVGRRKPDFESEVVRFVGKHEAGIQSIKESSDFELLRVKHELEISRLATLNFEVVVPLPESEAEEQ